MGPIRIGLIDFEPLRVTGLQEILGTRPDFAVTALDLAGAFRKSEFELGLYAVRPSRESIDLLARLRMRHPEMKIVAMGTGATDEIIMEAITAGAKGWIEETASPEQILQALSVVLSGSAWAPRRVLAALVERAYSMPPVPARKIEAPRFTGREAAVLQQLVLARSNREIAQALSIREQTVKSYVTRLMRKVGVANRIALSMEAAAERRWWEEPATDPDIDIKGEAV